MTCWDVLMRGENDISKWWVVRCYSTHLAILWLRSPEELGIFGLREDLNSYTYDLTAASSLVSTILISVMLIQSYSPQVYITDNFNISSKNTWSYSIYSSQWGVHQSENCWVFAEWNYQIHYLIFMLYKNRPRINGTLTIILRVIYEYLDFYKVSRISETS